MIITKSGQTPNSGTLCTDNLTLSASKVDCFYSCRRLFLYRYLRSPFPVRENKYFVVGNLVHKTLELYHMFKDSHTSCPVHCQELMKYAFETAIKQEAADVKLTLGHISREEVDSVKTMIKRYLELDLSEKLSVVTHTTVRDDVVVERKFIFLIDGVEVHGKIDQIREQNGHVLIVDYKTNKSTYSEKDVNESVQLPTYYMWVQREYAKAKSIKCVYLFLRPDSGVVTKEYTVSSDSLQSAEYKYKEAIKALRNPETLYHQNFKYKFCYTCDYKAHCINDTVNKLGG